MSSKTHTTATKEEATPALVPKLRFPEFRDAEAWKATPLGELGAIVTGKTPSTKEEDLWGGEILFITPTDITEDEKYQHTTQRTVIETKGTKVLPPGSVVYTCIASIGKMALTVVPSVTNQQINAVVPNGKTAREFIYYSLENLTPWIKSIPATSTLPIINKTQFSGFNIPHPEDKAEQQKIAECLSSVDELMAAQARKVDALKTHKKGLMQQLFPREGETQPRLRFPEFQNAGEWEETTLGEYFDPIRNGFVGTATPFYTTSDGVRYLQGKNIKDGKIDPRNLIFITPEFHLRQKKSHLKPGDILMVQSGHVGKCAVVDADYAGCNCHALVILSPKRKLSSEFFVHYFYAPVGELAIFQITTGNTIKHILASELKTLPVLVPEPAEQQRIATCLSSLDALITAETQKHEALKTHKKGLMQQLFPSPEEPS